MEKSCITRPAQFKPVLFKGQVYIGIHKRMHEYHIPQNAQDPVKGNLLQTRERHLHLPQLFLFTSLTVPYSCGIFVPLPGIEPRPGVERRPSAVRVLNTCPSTITVIDKGLQLKGLDSPALPAVEAGKMLQTRKSPQARNADARDWEINSGL